MTILFIDIYKRTVLISIGSVSIPGFSLRVFAGACVVRLAALVMIRIFHANDIVTTIDVVFDLINVGFFNVFLKSIFELGKCRFYHLRYTCIVEG
jgi:hypothetical protein